MSTLIHSENSRILESENDLASYFQIHSKPKENLKLGLEAEFFAVAASTGKALPYFGPHGIQEILKLLAEKFEYTPLQDGKNIIGLQKKDIVIALEPGGQIELSAPPVSNVFEVESQIQVFLNELRIVENTFKDIHFLACGIQPFSHLDEIEWVPKRRYHLMADYLGRHGSLSHQMMKRTATNQLNLDYTSEADAMDKLRTALSITSIVTAIFANSSFMEGKPNGYATYRLEIWNHTAPDRTGLILEFLEPGKSFHDYLRYSLEVPALFIVRNDEWIDLKGLSFSRFIRDGFQGIKPTLSDFELHLSTLFPEVRIKQYLEVRGADCQSPDLIPAVAALWKGILYDDKARREALELTAFASPEDRIKLHREVPRRGLQASLAGRPISSTSRKLVEIACEGLGRQQKPGSQNECLFLNRLRDKIIMTGKSPGDILVEKWTGEFQQQPQNLLQYLKI